MDKIFENNRLAWNEAFAYHKKARNGSLHKKFADPIFTTFDNTPNSKEQVKIIKSLKLKGKTVAHMQTNNGRELLSLMRISNAKTGIGFDISNDALDEARELAEIANVNAEFDCVNIFEISEKYNGYFDFIYITEGSFLWLPNITEYFKVMARLIKTGGHVFISEIHPTAFLLHNDYDKPVAYNDKGPYKMLTTLDYVGGAAYEPSDCFWYMHTMSDIYNAVAENNFSVQNFTESTQDTGAMDEENEFPNFPRSFTMLCKKL